MIIATLFFPMHVALFVLIASTKPGFFYCSNVDLLISLENPTTYCTITGITIHTQ